MISIHASAKEATVCHSGNQGHRIQISIHASAKEATFLSRCCCGSTLYFNPRLREGGDAAGSHHLPA